MIHRARNGRGVAGEAARAARITAVFGALALISAAGCDGPVVTPTDPELSLQLVERLTVSRQDRLDILLDIDNSRSMADKQQILAGAISELVRGFANPACIDDLGDAPAEGQPAGPNDPCPKGTRRRLRPITDIHIGVISSSLGGHGADACPEVEDKTCPSGMNTSNNDKAHLLSRLDPCGGSRPTYDDKGFLAWDPKKTLDPPGEGDLSAFEGGLREMVIGVGQIGCGFESQLESWYRFLVDPEPYESIAIVDTKATPMGIDSVLLKQRADFLRPDSVLEIILLSDENDCSIKEYSQFFLAAQLQNGNATSFHLPRPRSECAVDPSDPCCKSCGQAVGACPPDPSCLDANNNVAALTDLEDPSNLRCFDQKRRFGIDFLYPIERYTQALTSPAIPNRLGELVANPIFSDLNPADEHSSVRDAGSVFLTTIVGVPWQSIARDKNDLTKGFKTTDEMYATDDQGQSTWDKILGDPDKHSPPKDAHMVESINPRAGLPPPPDPLGALPDPIHGHEYTPGAARDDLQYACIFPLPKPRDCGALGEAWCDCKDGTNDNPVCVPADPANPTTTRTIQAYAKAYPGLRQLAVVKSISSQGVVGSVCPKQLTDTSAPDFGYRMALEPLLDRLSNVPGPSCLQQPLKADAAGQAPCLVLEARRVGADNAQQCNACASPGRQPVSSAHKGLVDLAKSDPLYEFTGWDCFCEIKQTTGGDSAACQSDTTDLPTNPDTGELAAGWCYIDGSVSPPVGNPDLVNACPEASKREIRFVGVDTPMNGSILFLACDL